MVGKVHDSVKTLSFGGLISAGLRSTVDRTWCFHQLGGFSKQVLIKMGTLPKFNMEPENGTLE